MAGLKICKENGLEVLRGHYEAFLQGEMDENFVTVTDQIITDSQLDEQKAKVFIQQYCSPAPPPKKMKLSQFEATQGLLLSSGLTTLAEVRMLEKVYGVLSPVKGDILRGRAGLDENVTGRIEFEVFVNGSGVGKMLKIVSHFSDFKEFEESLLRRFHAKLAEVKFEPEFYNRGITVTFHF